MDRITFSVNGDKCSVGSEVDSDVSLNEYLRSYLNMRGTKYMCKEGGCGACVVSVATTEHGQRRIFSVNSCLVSITSCQDWEVTTIEGIGGRGKGYHPLQRALAEYNGSQCGYCSGGFVMGMYSLLESNHYDVTQYEVENSFGSNTCRCTGYRPILDAFKSFAKDAPTPKKDIYDIEDIHICQNKSKCEEKCGRSWCYVKHDEEIKPKKIKLKDDKIWYRVKELKDIFSIFDSEGTKSYMLVNGNTGRGAVPIFEFPRVLIDISPVQEIKGHYIDQNLVIGAGTTLTDVMMILRKVSNENEEFRYLQKFYEHLDLVAHIPVRNIGSIAGNLMVKHRSPTFSSDIFLLFETVGATLTIVSKTKTIEITPEAFLYQDMKGNVITHVKLPPFSQQYRFVSFKIMPRSQNAHASVNGAFLYKFDHDKETVLFASIVFGGLSAQFVHARKTEKFLIGKKLFTNETLQGALKVLDEELIVTEIPGELKPEYRKKTALGLLYKGLLVLIPRDRLKPRYRSGARDFRKTRPLSNGIQVYDTNPIIWPHNEPMPKLDALIQCSGEAKYVNDLPTQPREVFCAFVPSEVCTGEIDSIDPSPALKLPGVLAFFSAKDIPGINSFLSLKIPVVVMAPEEVFCSGNIRYFNQPIGMIVAETEILANRAALLVKVTYKNFTNKPILTIDDVKKRDPGRVTLFLMIPARDRGVDVQRVIKGSDNILWQYHFTMETLSCVCRPSEDGIEVFSSTQSPDLTHAGISDVLRLEQNRIDVTIPRCGGAYGSRLSRAAHVATACSLATYLLDRPCRFVMSIQANIRIVGKRLPNTREFEVGVNSSGEIQYMEYHLYEDNGYIVSDPVIAQAPAGVKNCYDNRRWQFKLFNATTDTASNTWARSPGTLETISLTEHVMEQISYEIDRDPLEVRLNNLNPEYTDVADIVRNLIRDSEYQKRKQEVQNFNMQNRWKKRGIRVALMSWPIFLIADEQVVLSVYQGDATVVIQHGGTELGQGINTKVIQVVAYTLNISTDFIKVKATEVKVNTNNFLTSGSTSTHRITFGAIKCCQILLDRLMIVRETLSDTTWQVLIRTAFLRGINLQTSYRVTSNDIAPYRVAGAAVTEVELDILTGEHEILRVDLAEDTGLSLNPELDIGQIEGAFIMGVGYWTHEHIIYDENTGEILTDRTWTYHVPLSKDIPIDFRVQLRRNSFNPLGTLGSKAVAEPATCLAVSVAFALREAIVASREETGFPRNRWFNVDGPFTLEANVLKADVRLDEFLFY